MAKKPLQFGPYSFPTKTSCIDAIQAEQKHGLYQQRYMWGTEFDAPITCELLAHHHYGCVRHGVRPVRAKYDSQPYYPWPAFYGLINGWGWKIMSWHKAKDRWTLNEKTYDQAVGDKLRDLISEDLWTYRNKHPHCENSGCKNPADDVHHASPTFATLRDMTSSRITPQERLTGIAEHDWLQPSHDHLIPQHALNFFFHEHKKCSLVALCKECHNKMHY